MTVCRGVRGATTVDRNEREAILEATRELLGAMAEANGLQPGELASAIFTLTPDLDAAFPAAAARELGWGEVPLLDVLEIDVPGSLPRCIRALLHWNTGKAASEIVHIYLRGARALRPDIGRETPEKPGFSGKSGF